MVLPILSRIPLIRRLFPPVNPTSGDVRDFWNFMCNHYGTKVVEKHDSAGMKIIAEALGLMGILNKDAFLKSYTTTIGNMIYVPNPIGFETTNWSLWGQILICVHEHQHIVQDKKAGGLVYEWDYLANSASRTQYEVEAYRTSMEINWRYMRQMQSPKDLAAKLKNYNCNAEDIKVAEKALALAIPAIKAGALTTDSSRVAVGWLDVRFA
jgi:hypothetical protein